MSVFIRPHGLNTVYCALCDRNESAVEAMAQGSRVGIGVCNLCIAATNAKIARYVRDLNQRPAAQDTGRRWTDKSTPPGAA